MKPDSRIIIVSDQLDRPNELITSRPAQIHKPNRQCHRNCWRALPQRTDGTHGMAGAGPTRGEGSATGTSSYSSTRGMAPWPLPACSLHGHGEGKERIDRQGHGYALTHLDPVRHLSASNSARMPRPVFLPPTSLSPVLVPPMLASLPAPDARTATATVQRGACWAAGVACDAPLRRRRHLATCLRSRGASSAAGTGPRSPCCSLLSGTVARIRCRTHPSLLNCIESYSCI